jgi:hypothetical protein
MAVGGDHETDLVEARLEAPPDTGRRPAYTRPAFTVGRVRRNERRRTRFARKPSIRQAARNPDYVTLLAPTEPATPRISTRGDISREFP